MPFLPWLLIAGLVACTTQAAPNPLEAQPAAAPGSPAATGGAVRTVPFIKPGARFIYYGGSSSRGNEPNAKTSAGVGMSVYDVVAVTPTQVLVSARTFLGTGQKDGVYTYAATSALKLGSLEVSGGSAFWMPVDELAALRSGGGVEISRGPYPLGGQSYDSVSILIQGQDSASRQVYDAGTGLELATQNATGPMLPGHNDPFMRNIQSSATYESYRQVDTWVGPAPAWVGTVQSLTYAGNASMMGNAIGVSATYQVVDRGPDWLVTSLTQHVQNGTPEPPTPTVEGSGKPFGLWVSPEVLARLQPGVIDRDPTLNTAVSYQVQGGPMGQLGVFTETNARGTYTLIAGYSLQDGVLAYAQSIQAETGYTITLQLQGRR